MKWGYIADPLDFQSAGIYRYVKGWVDNWPLAFTEDENHLIRYKQEEVPGWIVHAVKGAGGNFGKYTRKWIDIPRKINKINPDVVIESAHFGPYNLNKKIKRFVTIHDLSPITRPSNHTFRSEYAHRYFLKPLLKRVEGVIVNSEKTKYEVAEVLNFPLERIQVVYPGIESHFKRTVDEERLSELGIKTPYFLHIGTIEPRKQIHKVIHAFERWCLEYPDSDEQLVLAGRMGWKMHAFPKMIAQSPVSSRIIYLDYVKDSDLPILYSHASALLFLSIDEGFGFPIPEALFCGCPVVAGDIMVFKESGGSYPIFVANNEEDHVIEAMDEAMKTTFESAHIREKLAHLSWHESFLNLKAFIEQF